MIIKVRATLVSEPKFRSNGDKVIAEIPISLDGSYFILRVPGDRIDNKSLHPGSDVIFPVYVETKGAVIFSKEVEVA